MSNDGRKRERLRRRRGPEALIDRLLPRFEARILSTVVVDAATGQTYRARGV